MSAFTAADTRLVPAVDRAARILKLLRQEDRYFSISEVARALAISKGTVRDILVTLHHHGLVERDEQTRRYRLGPALLYLGGAMLSRMDLRAVARPFLHRLMSSTGETVFLGVRDGDRVMILDKEEAPGDLKITSPVGRRIPLTAGCFGKIFLAYVPAEERRELLSCRGLPAFTARTITDLQEYEVALRQVRSQGYALDDEEYLEGVRAAGAPVFDMRGELVGAIAVVGLASRMTDAKLRLVVQELVDAAEEVSSRLGAGRAPDGPPRLAADAPLSPSSNHKQ